MLPASQPSLKATKLKPNLHFLQHFYEASIKWPVGGAQIQSSRCLQSPAGGNSQGYTMRFHGFESNVFWWENQSISITAKIEGERFHQRSLGGYHVHHAHPLACDSSSCESARQTFPSPRTLHYMLPNSGVDSKIRLNARNDEHKPRASKESACGEAASLPGGLNELN